MFYIYGLTDPRSMQVFYVGCTKDPRQRLKDHIRAKHEGGNGKKVKERIADIAKQGLAPSIVILEQTEDKAREKHWIEHCRFLGLALVNVVLFPTGGRPKTPKKTHEELSEIARKTHAKRKAKRKAAYMRRQSPSQHCD